MISDDEMDHFFDATTEDGNSLFSAVDNHGVSGVNSAHESMSESSDNRGDPIDGPWFVDDDGTISDEETCKYSSHREPPTVLLSTGADKCLASASERDVPKMGKHPHP